MFWKTLLLIPVVVGCAYWIGTTLCLALFFRKKGPTLRFGKNHKESPFVSLIKPVCGLEKNLYENLETACGQDYSNYEIIYSVQSKTDPAIKILERIQKENHGKNIQILIDETAVGPNGRLANIYNASLRSKGDILVFSDSDMSLKPDYLKTITAPLSDEKIGVVCTLYKSCEAHNIPEFLELLSFNTDFVPSVVFANVTRTQVACVGASQAIRRDVLEKIGGLKPLAHYLVEDFELGRLVQETGFQILFLPYVAKTTVDLKNFKDWWRHQVYWDQNTRAANAPGFFFTFLIRGIPFALLYALLGGTGGGAILLSTMGVRITTTLINSIFLKDIEGTKSLWLLPIRDVLGLFVWLASFIKRKTYWKGRSFVIEKGKMVEIEESGG